jgi:hypothetical protein
MLTPLTFELVILTASEIEGEESPYLFLRIQPTNGLFRSKSLLTRKGLPHSELAVVATKLQTALGKIRYLAGLRLTAESYTAYSSRSFALRYRDV